MATLGYEFSFTPNTAAKATEVNSNFNAVKVFVDGLSTGANIEGFAITEPKINGGAVTETKIANGAVTTDKINNSAVTNAKLDYTTVPRMTVSATEPTSIKAGDIWVQI